MLDKIAMVLKENEGLKNFNAFSEINKKMSPSELLSKGERNGILGSLKEQKSIFEEMQHGIIRSEVDVESENKKIKEKTNYSDDVNDYITTVEELEVYKNENLEEGKVNDRTTLKNPDIDPNLKDDMGRTNIERMEKGRAPIDENGDPYNLHHIGQKSDSPLAELKNETHKTNSKILHDNSQPTEIHKEDSGVNWDKERSDHWKARVEEMKGKKDV